MKYKRIIFAALLMTAMVLPAVAQKKNTIAKDPDHANWVIKGIMHSGFQNDSVKYWLDDVSSKNIFFTEEENGIYNHAFYNIMTEKVGFKFRDAYTYPSDKINSRLILWTKNSKDKWIQDAEKTENKMTVDSTKILSVVLVLDCSGSMSENNSKNFDIMQDNAVKFLDSLYKYSRAGNIHVGLVGFNTTIYALNHTVTPKPLTYQNYYTLRNSIKDLKSILGAGTALYYSIDRGFDLLIEDYESILDKDLFNGAALVCFTDGKDNLSKDPEKRKITNLRDYLKHMQDTYCTEDLKIGGKPLYKRLIGFKGENVDKEEWESMVEDVTSIFCEDGAFIPITKIDQLSEVFSDISKQLIRSNMSLICQVPSAIVGPVAWTIPEYENTQIPRERKPSKVWVGLMAEIGNSFYSYQEYYYEYDKSVVFEGVTLDVAWPLTSKFGLGGSLGFTVSDEGVGYGLGPLAKITFDDNSALLLGLGIKSVIDLGPYFSFGWKFRSPWYLKASLIADADLGYSFGIGYSILGK